MANFIAPLITQHVCDVEAGEIYFSWLVLGWVRIISACSMYCKSLGTTFFFVYGAARVGQVDMNIALK